MHVQAGAPAPLGGAKDSRGSPPSTGPGPSCGTRHLVASGLVLIAGVVAYSVITGWQVSPLMSSRRWDKLWQLVCLGPAIMGAAILAGCRLRFDMAAFIARTARRVPSALFVLMGLLVLTAVAAGPLERLPGSRDEVQYLFQGRALAAGRLSAPPPPCPKAFALRGMTVWNGRWITPYEPGHPLLLGIADRIGIAWMVGPIMGAISLWLLFLLAGELYGPGLARCALTLGVLSPFFVFLAACHSYHGTSLALSTLVLLALAKAHRRGPTSAWAYGLGAGLGGLLFVRPLAWGVLLPPIAVLEFHQWRREGAPWARWRRILVTVLPLAVVWMLYNHAVTGHALRTARQCVYPHSLFGFGEAAAHGPSYGTVGHSPLKGMFNLVLQFATLSTGLLGWPLVSLLPAAVGFWVSRRSAWGWAFVLAIVVTACILFFSWYSAVEHGPRHYLDAWPGLMVLSAVGLRAGVRRLRLGFGPGGSNAAIVGIGGFFVLSFLLYVPIRIQDVITRSLGVDPRVHEEVREKVQPPALVFMDTPSEPTEYFCSGFVHNDPLLRSPIIYARHISAEADSACLRSFPGRKAYLLVYDPGAGILDISDHS